MLTFGLIEHRLGEYPDYWGNEAERACDVWLAFSVCLLLYSFQPVAIWTEILTHPRHFVCCT